MSEPKAPQNDAANTPDPSRAGRHRGGVQGLSFNVYVYDDHSRVSVTRDDFAPLTGPRLRLGSFSIALGRGDLHNLAPADAVHAVALAIDDVMTIKAMAETLADAIGAPEGATGGSVEPVRYADGSVQLRLPLPD